MTNKSSPPVEFPPTGWKIVPPKTPPDLLIRPPIPVEGIGDSSACITSPVNGFTVASIGEEPVVKGTTVRHLRHTATPWIPPHPPFPQSLQPSPRHGSRMVSLTRGGIDENDGEPMETFPPLPQEEPLSPILDPIVSPDGFSILRLDAVQEMWSRLMAKDAVDLGAFKRILSHRNLHPAFDIPRKPSALKVEEIVDPSFFRSGDTQLPAKEAVLNIDFLTASHRNRCSLCSSVDGIHPECYFTSLQNCAKYGLNPVLKPDSDGIPVPNYTGQGVDGNHRSADAYPAFVKSQVDDMLFRGAIEQCEEQDLDVISSLGVAIAKSAIRQTELLTGICIRNQSSLDQALAIATGKNIDLRLKLRLILDLKGSGLNDTLDKRPFSFVGPEDVAVLMTPGCYFASCDGSKYYYHFPLAEQARRKIGFIYEGKYYRHAAMAFGASAGPCLVSGFSAEFLAGIQAQDVRAVCIIDDFLIVAADEQEALRSQGVMEDFLTRAGIVLEDTKRGNPSTTTVFSGILYDSIAMTTAVNPPSAGRCALTLEIILEELESGRELSEATIHHIAGKLSDYSKVCEQGKTKIWSTWEYLKYGQDLWPVVRLKMIEDLKWWISKLFFWAGGGTGGCFPVVNRSTLQAPGAVRFLISDYSGPDGYGGLSGAIEDDNPRFFSAQHPESLSSTRTSTTTSSFVGELKVLLCDLEHEKELASSMSFGTASPPSCPPCILTVWVTDNESAAFAVNSGRCRDPEGIAILEKCFDIANTLRRSVVAVWVPRVANEITDKLSHFAHSIHCREVVGRFADLPGDIRAGPGGFIREGDSSETFGQTGSGTLRQVRDLLPRGIPPDGLRGGGGLRDRVHDPQQWPYSFTGQRGEPPSNSTRQEEPCMVDTRGGNASDEPGGPIQVGGHRFDQPDASPPFVDDCKGNQHVGLEFGTGAPGGHSSLTGHPGPPTDEGGHAGPQRVTLHLEGGWPIGGHKHWPNQDMPSGLRRLRRAGERGARIHAPAEAFQGAEPPQQLELCLLHDSEWGAVSSQVGVRGVIPPADQANGRIHRSEPQVLQRSLLSSGRRH